MIKTNARIKRGGKHFEILVDLDEAMKVRNNIAGANLSSAVLTDAIFHNLKSGEKASSSDLMEFFESSDVMVVAEKIIKSGEVVKPVEAIRDEQDKRYKQVVDFLNKNAVSPEGRPYTPDKIMRALQEAHVNVKNKAIETQISDIVDALSKILPIKIEEKKIKLRIPVQYTGKAYGAIKEFMIEENWMPNGDLEVVIKIPSGLVFDFYDKINGITQGSVLSEELKS